MGTWIPPQHRQKGNRVDGKPTTEVAGASIGGALVLGPIGLGAGYFFVGKSVYEKTGDPLETQVSKDVTLHGH